MIGKWVKKYIAEGDSSFVHKGHPGNPFAALHVSKNLSEVERLRLTVAKLEVENERLKKGYLAKGVGASKEFDTGREKSSRSSTGSDLDFPKIVVARSWSEVDLVHTNGEGVEERQIGVGRRGFR